MDAALQPGRNNRLIVLIPECLAGDLDLARKVFWMAQRLQCEVLYLALVDDPEASLSVTRLMATMSAITSGGCLAARAKITPANRWLQSLGEVYRPGDRIVCQQEQVVRGGFLQTMPVDAFLHDRLRAPVLTLSGFYHPERYQVRLWLHSLVIWLGFFLILAGFTALEIHFDGLLGSAAGKLLFCVLLVVEIGAIWAWNRISAQLH